MSATVWKAICKPLGEVVAVKLLDLESLNVRIEEIVKEVRIIQTPRFVSSSSCSLT